MKGSINHRLAVLEANSGSPVLKTLADFVVWHARGCPRPVEIEPRLLAVLSNSLTKKQK